MNRSATRVFGALVLGLALCLSATADDRPLIEKKPAGKEPTNDQEFLTKALAGDITEIKVSERVLKHTKNEQVRKFAQMMIDDHSRSRDALMERAREMKIAVVEGADPEKREKIDRMFKMEGSEFDREYARWSVEDHENALRLWSTWAEKARDEKLRELARKTVPTIKEHLEHARRLGDKLKE